MQIFSAWRSACQLLPMPLILTHSGLRLLQEEDDASRLPSNSSRLWLGGLTEIQNEQLSRWG